MRERTSHFLPDLIGVDRNNSILRLLSSHHDKYRNQRRQLSKAYSLGQIGTGTLTYDMKLWWAKLRGKPNPLLRIGETDHGNRDGETIWALKDVSFTVEQG